MLGIMNRHEELFCRCAGRLHASHVGVGFEVLRISLTKDHNANRYSRAVNCLELLFAKGNFRTTRLYFHTNDREFDNVLLQLSSFPSVQKLGFHFMFQVRVVLCSKKPPSH